MSKCEDGCDCFRHPAGELTRQGMHSKVKRRRGDASNYKCDGCDKQAYDWSHIDGTDRQDVNNYIPRCHECHGKYDFGGEKSYACKLPDGEVAEMREMYATGKWKQCDLADIFDISKQHTSAILRGKKR